MTTVITSCILFQHLQCNENIQVDKAPIHFLNFFKKVSIVFRNFLVTMASIKNGMNLK